MLPLVVEGPSFTRPITPMAADATDILASAWAVRFAGRVVEDTVIELAPRLLQPRPAVALYALPPNKVGHARFSARASAHAVAAADGAWAHMRPSPRV